jgi:3-aminobutyryl-CoA ammonia-lyase
MKRSPEKIRVGSFSKIDFHFSKKDAHYAKGLVAGAKILEIFGDAATELCLRETGGTDEGLFRAYESVDFLKPAYAGDRIVVAAKVLRVGKTSRRLSFTAKNKNVTICRAVGTVVIPSLGKKS